MKPEFKHVALVGKYQNKQNAAKKESPHDVLQAIANFIRQLGYHLSVEQDSAKNACLSDFNTLSLQEIGAQCDVCIVVGGDGTMLGVSRQLAACNIPLIGINQGRLGFITDIALDDYANILPAMLMGEYVQDLRALMHGRVMRQDHCIFDTLAMNDVVVHRDSTAGMVELRIEVDDAFVANYRSDGIIVATPTGSTAYALSAGGPLMHPLLAGWSLVPISPHTLSNRPIVLADPGQITIEIVAGKNANASFDMQSLACLRPADRIIVKRSAHQVRFLHPAGWTYFNTLREKLHWNKGGN